MAAGTDAQGSRGTRRRRDVQAEAKGTLATCVIMRPLTVKKLAELRSARTAEGGRPYAFSGFHLRTGLRAAAVSSRREMRVLCGASSTNFGSSSTSSAIDFIDRKSVV